MRKGFTLLECIIAILFLSLSVIAFFKLSNQGIEAETDADRQRNLLYHSSSLAESIKGGSLSSVLMYHDVDIQKLLMDCLKSETYDCFGSYRLNELNYYYKIRKTQESENLWKFEVSVSTEEDYHEKNTVRLSFLRPKP